MGIALAVLSFGSLIGAFSARLSRTIVRLMTLLKGGPLSGALLTSEYKWWRPSLFSGVCSRLTVGQRATLLIRFVSSLPSSGLRC